MLIYLNSELTPKITSRNLLQPSIDAFPPLPGAACPAPEVVPGVSRKDRSSEESSTGVDAVEATGGATAGGAA